MLIYIDTNIFKFSATKLLRLFPKQQEVNWGPTKSIHQYYEIGHLNPNEFIRDKNLRSEAELLPLVAKKIKSGHFTAVTHSETLLESWGIPNMDSEGGRFYGAPVGNCACPVVYERIIIGGTTSPETMQLNFLSRIKEARFVEIQKVVGAHQGEGVYHSNQLLDAFAIWCAEHAKCNAFLSLDYKLARVIQSDRKNRIKLPVLRPSELLALEDKN
jgi:hypothetical protein